MQRLLPLLLLLFSMNSLADISTSKANSYVVTGPAAGQESKSKSLTYIVTGTPPGKQTASKSNTYVVTGPAPDKIAVSSARWYVLLGPPTDKQIFTKSVAYAVVYSIAARRQPAVFINTRSEDPSRSPIGFLALILSGAERTADRRPFCRTEQKFELFTSPTLR